MRISLRIKTADRFLRERKIRDNFKALRSRSFHNLKTTENNDAYRGDIPVYVSPNYDSKTLSAITKNPARENAENDRREKEENEENEENPCR